VWRCCPRSRVAWDSLGSRSDPVRLVGWCLAQCLDRWWAGSALGVDRPGVAVPVGWLGWLMNRTRGQEMMVGTYWVRAVSG